VPYEASIVITAGSGLPLLRPEIILHFVRISLKVFTALYRMIDMDRVVFDNLVSVMKSPVWLATPSPSDSLYLTTE
jgi:hypothetical protein